MSSNIPVQNIYYMLSYAFQVLKEKSYSKIATEEFKNTSDMFAAIIIKGVEQQIKRFLNREYISEKDSLSVLRGKIEINDTLNSMSIIKKQIVCSFDEFSIDSYMNQILKSTMILLIHSDISKHRVKHLQKLLVYFSSVKTIDLHRINWKLQFTRNNQTYRMLMGICYLIVKGLLQTQKDGSNKLMDFLDEQQMYRLYEKFILEYYKKEHPKLKATSKEIKWITDNGFTQMLPIMQSDIMLSYNNKILIIDAKYYSHTTQIYFDKHTIRSANIYQIFTYVKNKQEEEKSQKVSGLLLYAKTENDIFEEQKYLLSGNEISVKTLDLNVSFPQIKNQLDKIVEFYFNLNSI